MSSISEFVQGNSAATELDPKSEEDPRRSLFQMPVDMTWYDTYQCAAIVSPGQLTEPGGERLIGMMQMRGMMGRSGFVVTIHPLDRTEEGLRVSVSVLDMASPAVPDAEAAPVSDWSAPFPPEVFHDVVELRLPSSEAPISQSDSREKLRRLTAASDESIQRLLAETAIAPHNATPGDYLFAAAVYLHVAERGKDGYRNRAREILQAGYRRFRDRWIIRLLIAVEAPAQRDFCRF